MEKTDNQPEVQAETTVRRRAPATGYEKFKQIFGRIVMALYRLRKVAMAAPVVYYALKIAKYNSVNLPEMVGLNLQANGEFALMITRQLAVLGPLALTGGCLLMMFLSRKAMYSWAISAFTLVLPVVLFLSNRYPL